MCGRFAQTQRAVHAAALSLCGDSSSSSSSSSSHGNSGSSGGITGTDFSRGVKFFGILSGNGSSTSINNTSAVAESGCTATIKNLKECFSAIPSSTTSAASNSNDNNNNNRDDHTMKKANVIENKDSSDNHRKDDDNYNGDDNYNLSPGMDATVFYIKDKDHQQQREGEGVKVESGANLRTQQQGRVVVSMDRMVWGLVPKGGTTRNPLPLGMSQHFSNLMFNARTDTLYEKHTFAKLLSQKRTCLVAIDGFFEWKEDPLPGMKGKKQPYYVSCGGNEPFKSEQRKTEEPLGVGRGCLLIAGLWTSVPTGRDDNPTLDTFTLLTTDVCDPLKWLHGRMPVCLWNMNYALRWLQDPSKMMLQKIDETARRSMESDFRWHPVTREMNKTKYRNKDSIKPLPKPKLVTSFFAPKAKYGGKESKKTDLDKIQNKKRNTFHSGEFHAQTGKHTAPATSQSTLPKPSKRKMQKNTGPIKSFFLPKVSK